jgi:hypothetical protein
MPPDRPSRFEPFAGLPVASVHADPGADDGWQLRFLASPLLRRLDPVHWQQLLQGMTVERLAAGETLFEAGAPGDACYVVQSGRVCVHDGGRRLAVLEPGALFGEDALITGGWRNASVTLLTEGRVGRLPTARFERWLLHAAIRPLTRIGTRVPLCVDPGRPVPAGGIALALARIRAPGDTLSRSVGYCVVGGRLRERLLAAFVLAQQGYDVLPLDGADPADPGPASADR